MIGNDRIGSNGRLGNQMFQYASMRGIAASRGYDWVVPPQDYDHTANYALFETFNMSTVKPENIGFVKGKAPHKIIHENDHCFSQDFFDECPDNSSLEGFFQTEKYFKDIEASIKEDFKFRDHVLKPCIEMAESLDDAVSLHVRRTDYLQNSGNHFNLQLDYYEKALSKIDADRTVVVFSDDPEWCKEQELFSDDRFLVSESGDNAVDLCLMTFCKAHIIANSSFSWWGAWLSGSDEVIAPSTWFGPENADKSTEDLIPERWTLI